MTDPYIIDVDQTNINDVLQKSMQTPVLLNFYSTMSEPSNILSPILVTIADDYQGKFILARVDSDAMPEIAQQLGVRAIPALKLVVKGQLAGELEGAQQDVGVRQLLEAHIGVAEASGQEDPFVGQIQRAVSMGALDEAIASLESAITEQPTVMAYQALYADVLMDAKRIDDAEAVIKNMGDDALVPKTKARLFFVRLLEGAESAEHYQAQIQADGGGSESRYYLGAYLVILGQEETALNLLLSVMMNDREYKEDGARLALLSAFDFMGKDNPLTSRYRRKLFALLH
ncbi:MAG: tetratricopeptide repeat protein [Pseudomonadales bacterium]|nr:tetratricopeptide repeat protein [Pseudomonadales bacterium]